MLDVSASFVEEKAFRHIIRRILREKFIYGENNVEVYGFAETMHELSRADLIELLEMAEDKIERNVTGFPRVTAVFGGGTRITPVLDFIRKFNFKYMCINQNCQEKDMTLTIHGDFEFYE